MLCLSGHDCNNAPNNQVGQKNQDRTCAHSNKKRKTTPCHTCERKCAEACADDKDKNYALQQKRRFVAAAWHKRPNSTVNRRLAVLLDMGRGSGARLGRRCSRGQSALSAVTEASLNTAPLGSGMVGSLTVGVSLSGGARQKSFAEIFRRFDRSARFRSYVLM